MSKYIQNGSMPIWSTFGEFEQSHLGSQQYNKQQDYKMAQLMCLYLMYKKEYNETNAELFHRYGELLRRTIKTREDCLKSEKYFLKALSINNNLGSVHNNYAILLKNNFQNYDKAEYHYKQSSKIDPNIAARTKCQFCRIFDESTKKIR